MQFVYFVFFILFNLSIPFFDIKVYNITVMSDHYKNLIGYKSAPTPYILGWGQTCNIQYSFMVAA